MQHSIRADGTRSMFISAKEIAVIRTGKVRRKSGSSFQYVDNKMVVLPNIKLYPDSGGFFFGDGIRLASNSHYNKSIWERSSPEDIKEMLLGSGTVYEPDHFDL